jgi:hypothetical protein
MALCPQLGTFSIKGLRTGTTLLSLIMLILICHILTFHPFLIIIKPQGFYHLISKSVHYCLLTHNKDWKLIPEQGSSAQDLKDKIMLYYSAYTGISNSSHCLVSCLCLNHCEGEDFAMLLVNVYAKAAAILYLLPTLWTWEGPLIQTVDITNINFQI